MVETIMKRDGRTVEFKQEKIAEAVERAFQACGAMQDTTPTTWASSRTRKRAR